MSSHRIGTREEWLTAAAELLSRERLVVAIDESLSLICQRYVK
jgi:hypothetical protein